MPGLPSDDERTPTRDHRVLVALLVLCAAALAAAVASYVADGGPLTANLSWTLGATAAVLGVASAVRRSEDAARSGWRLLLWACGCWLAGQLCWDVYIATQIQSSPSPADVFLLAFAGVAAAAVLRLARGAEGGRAVSALEVAPIIVAVCTLLSALLWDSIGASDLSVLGQTTALAYPALYVSAALVMVQAVVAGSLDLDGNHGLGAVLAGLVVEAVAFILWSPTLLQSSYAAGQNPIDLLWTAGLVLVGLGAHCAGPVRPAGPRRAGGDRGGVLPGATFCLLAVAQAVLILTGAEKGAVLALTLGLMIVGCTLMARGTLLRRAQESLYTRVRERERELQVLNVRLGEESRSDPLTGLGNRLRLSEDIVELDARAQRYEHGYCLVLCDLDRFKAYNDRMGHQAGDDVLCRVARLLERNARAGDRIYRYGGEELLLVLPEQDEQAGRVAAEHHRAALEHAALPHPLNTPDVVTFSAGVAAAGLFESPEDVLRRADRALYEAKAAGRNRVRVADPVAI